MTDSIHLLSLVRRTRLEPNHNTERILSGRNSISDGIMPVPSSCLSKQNSCTLISHFLEPKLTHSRVLVGREGV